MRILACGDIHGNKDKLVQALLTAGLIDSNEDWVAPEVILVFLGDYTDRGPKTSEVVDLLIKLKTQAVSCNSHIVTLMGNHEKMLLDAAYGNESMLLWLYNGGIQTLQSYGVPLSTSSIYLIEPKALEPIMQKHGSFYRSLKSHFVYNDTMFVHAGLKPWATLETMLQDEEYLWIREDFFYHKDTSFLRKNYGVSRVVFGHTIHSKVTAYHGGAYLAVDTGSFQPNGKISIVELLPNLKYTILA